MNIVSSRQSHHTVQQDLNTTYRVVDRIPLALAERIGLPHDEAVHALSILGCYKSVRAQWTGEFRPPKKGEWYLSGAVVEAYLAKNDLQSPYHLARLVRVRTEVVEIVEPIPSEKEEG